MNDAELKDKILEYLITQSTSQDFSQVKQNVLPELEVYQIEDLFVKILSCENAGVTKIGENEYTRLKATGSTKVFLKDGGFTKMNKKTIKQIEYEIRMDNLKLQNLEAELKIANQKIKDLPRTKKLANISIAIALGLAVLEVVQFLMQYLSQE